MAGLLDRLFGGNTHQRRTAEPVVRNIPSRNTQKNEHEMKNHQEQEGIAAEVEKEDFLLKQIDEFREKAAQLQKLLLTKESKVAELQNIVAEREEEAEQLQTVLNDRKEAAEVLLTGVQSQMNEMISEVENKLNTLAEKIANDVNDSTGRTAEQTAEMKAALDEISKQLDTMKLELAEKIHAEDVKCYRNMADLIAELTKKVEENDELEYGIHTLKILAGVITGLTVVNLIGIVGLILYSLEIIRF